MSDDETPYITIENARFVTPETTMHCDLLGNGFIVFDVYKGQEPSAWKRFWTRFFLGTKWTHTGEGR